MKAYKVISGNEGKYQDEFLYLYASQAKAHLDSIRNHERIDLGDYSRLDMIEIDSVPDQVIKVAGKTIGYQFSRTCLGKRTAYRTVSNLISDGNESIGEITWHGHSLFVRQRAWWQKWEVIPEPDGTTTINKALVSTGAAYLFYLHPEMGWHATEIQRGTNGWIDNNSKCFETAMSAQQWYNNEYNLIWAFFDQNDRDNAMLDLGL